MTGTPPPTPQRVGTIVNIPPPPAQQAGTGQNVPAPPLTTAVPYRPTKPKFGDVSEIGKESWVAWTGGKPKADWSELDNPNPSVVSPNQYRPSSIGSQSKSQYYRVRGLETKFTRGSDLQTFEKKIMKHLISYGLDTITYLVDPTDSTQVVSVISEHARFNVKVGVKLGNDALVNYDSYDLENIRDAKEFLLNSVDDELETQLYENCKDDDSFIAYWLNLTHIVRSVSIDRFDKVKDRIKSRKIANYAGENVEAIVTDFLSDWKELHGAGLYDQNLTLTMLNSIMEAGGTANEDFRHPLRDVKLKLNKKLLEVRHMSYANAHTAMVTDELDVQSVTKAAKEQYRELYDANKWPAASHAKDSKAMNKNFGNVNMAATTELKRVVNALIQNAGGGSSRDKSNDLCKNCNKKGHWARECPEKKKGGYNAKPFNTRGKTSSSGNSGRDGSRRNNSSPRTPPPKSGEAEIKFINGKKSYWCSKCNRWTLSHGTDNHKSKEELKGSSPTAGMARVNFDLHPSAFMTMGPTLTSESQFNISTLQNSMNAIMSIMFMMTWVWIIFNHTNATEVAINFVNYIQPSLMSCMNLISENLITMILGAASGIIGFGGTAYLFVLSSEVVEPNTRYRNGPNFIKRMKRQLKAPKTSRKHSRWNHITVPDSDMRANLSNHSKFNHIGRNLRYEPPNVERIRLVKARIRGIRKEMSYHEKRLKELRKELYQQERKLKDLIARERPWCEARRHNKKQPQPSCEATKPEKPFSTSFIEGFKCAMANLVNLSEISSNPNNKPKSEYVLFDSGANCCVTNRRNDFIGEFHIGSKGQLVDGIGKGLMIEGHGRVAWTFKANNDMYRTVVVPCYYIPTSNTRIASLQEILKAYPKETVSMNEHALTLSGYDSVPAITVPYCSSSNLPMAATEDFTPVVNKGERKKAKKENLPSEKHPSLTTAANMNLSEYEKELLRWHHRLGHIGMKRVQWLFRQGILSTSERTRRLQAAASKLSHGPMCTACQYAKQRRKTMPGSIKHSIKQEAGALKRNDVFPGQEISIDHFICNPKGRLLSSYGKEPIDTKYKGGCIFVDHSSGYTHVELQTHLNSHATLDAKKAFEAMCAEHGVIPQTFLSDNGTSFVNKDFEEHLSQFHQTIHHSAVGAHHSNGIAERGISTVMSIARAMLHHAAIHWPDVADVELWPLAVLHAAHVLNRIPREDSGRSPIELFSRKTWASSKFHDFHVWGCPVYVLDTTLSDGHKLPRWKPRSTRSIYVGNSMKHGHAIPLVLCTLTGKITAQYHVVFDDWFQTVEATNENKVNFEHDDWYHTFGLTESQYVEDDHHDTEPADSAPPVIELEGANRRESVRSFRDQVHTPQPVTDQKDTLQREPPQDDPIQRGSSLQRETDPEPKTLPVTPRAPKSPEPTPAVTQPPPSPLKEASPPALVQAPSLQRETSSIEPTRLETPQEVAPSVPIPRRPRPARRLPADYPRRPVTRSQAHYANDHAHLYESLFVGKAAHTDPDTFTWEQAMASPHKEDFLSAAQAEIDALVEKGTWYEDNKDNATTKIIPSQWVFRIKRTPDGVIKKFKGRICLRGDLQEDDGQTNFSPVAAWPTVRSFLVISIIRNWITTTIDFSNAFVQSDLPANEPVWMHVPRGYRSSQGSSYCLKLVKSLYGHKRAPLLWFNHSTEAFKKLGLTQSKHDPCLWYGKDIMLVQYVDDCGISAPNQERIEKFVNDLKGLNFELTQEGSFSEFLGIKFETLPDGSIECTQKGLIQKTLEAAGMENCNPNSVPAAQAAVGTDKDGEPMDDSWNYRGICGMLLYLSTNTRPDIAFAVSQVCRFGHDPKKSHATAVKTILRYLKKTCDKGIIVKPNDNAFNLDMYVDADFCGLFGREDPRDSSSVKSRTGYIIILCGWPIVWKSHLQTHLSQSTLEAEYSALSSSLRVFLPLRWLIEEMIDETKCRKLEDARLHATVFEDNQSTYFLATNHRITSRTKYLLAKWHWFWDAYDRSEFTIVKCPTNEQFSDYLTKSQPKATFEINRKAVQGW